MNKCVSYAYFRSPQSAYEKIKGNSALQFEAFLPLIVRAHHVLWEGYDLLIHHDTSVPSLSYWPALERLYRAGFLRLIPCGSAERICESMLWRMRPVWDGYDIVVCRDLDLIPTPQDREVVEDWLATGKAVCVIHSAMAHAGVMGGTLSVRSARFRELIAESSWSGFVNRFSGISMCVHGDDQHLLNRLLPRYAGETVTYDPLPHDPDVPGSEIRRAYPSVGGLFPEGFDVEAAKILSPGCGICADCTKGFAFYDALPLDVIRRIREAERG